MAWTATNKQRNNIQDKNKLQKTSPHFSLYGENPYNLTCEISPWIDPSKCLITTLTNHKLQEAKQNHKNETTKPIKTKLALDF